MTHLLSCAIFITLPSTGLAQRSPGVGFAMAGMTEHETARVNALNLGNGQFLRGSSCAVTLQFRDSSDQVLKETRVTLQPGKAAWLDLHWDKTRMTGIRAEVRAVVLYGYSGGANPPAMVLQNFDCNIVPSFEVYGNERGSTIFVLTDTKPLPAVSLPPIQ